MCKIMHFSSKLTVASKNFISITGVTIFWFLSSQESSHLGYSWAEFAKICSLVENTQINNVRKIQSKLFNKQGIEATKCTYLRFFFLYIERYNTRQERQQNCSIKFNITLSNSIKSRRQYNTTISVKRMQFYCAVICLFPSVEVGLFVCELHF